MNERKNEATINGTPLTALGDHLQPGSLAPEVTLKDGTLTTFNLLSDTADKIRIISVVPCIDTGLCEMQTLRVNEEINRLQTEEIVAITVSTDLPESQARFCGRAGVENITMLSDHMDMQFGAAYGTWLKELRKEQRSVFVVDKNNVVQHAEYVSEVGHAINYEAVFAVVNALLHESKTKA